MGRRSRKDASTVGIANAAAEHAGAAATWVAVDSLVPWARNPRKNDGAVPVVGASILRLGFGSPIVARTANREIIAGHTRALAIRWCETHAVDAEDGRIRKRTAEDGPFMVEGAPGPGMVPVRFLDIDEARAHALALADNKTGEIAEWDDEALAGILRDLQSQEFDVSGLGWDPSEIASITEHTDGSAGEDVVPEPSAIADSVPGTRYVLGKHVLVCGDSRDQSSWDLLFSDGVLAQMMWTDPPYGVSYVGKTSEALTIQNDKLSPSELEAFLSIVLGLALSKIKDGSSIYVASPAVPLFHVFGTVLLALNVWKHTLVWAKDRFVLGRSDYHYRHEAIFYGWKEGASHYFVDDRTQDSVHEIDRPSRNAEHPTMKPVELIQLHIRNSSKDGWVIVDPFGGSGSTLIAADAEGRVSRLIELDPIYCDVIRKRWTHWARSSGRDPGPGALD